MKVLILKSAAGPDGIFKKGEERDLSDAVATQLVKDGIARPVAVKKIEKAQKAESVTYQKREKRKK